MFQDNPRPRIPLGPRTRRACAAALLLSAALPVLAQVREPTLEPPAAPVGECRPDDRDASDRRTSADEPETRPEATPLRPIFDPRTTRLFLLVPFVAVPIVGYVAWWKRDSGVHFHTVDEGWFGKDTYAGGADKTSHFY